MRRGRDRVQQRSQQLLMSGRDGCLDRSEGEKRIEGSQQSCRRSGSRIAAGGQGIQPSIGADLVVGVDAKAHQLVGSYEQTSRERRHFQEADVNVAEWSDDGRRIEIAAGDDFARTLRRLPLHPELLRYLLCLENHVQEFAGLELNRVVVAPQRSVLDKGANRSI